jgi:very-short-patch-repair endonuclease
MQRHKPLRRNGPIGHGSTARAMDSNAERRLWSLLRDAPAAGLQFHRRERIGPYVAAFCCPAAKLIVDFESDQDEQREEWFQLHGYRVLRFSEREVLANPRSVLDAISGMFEIRTVPDIRAVKSDPHAGGR